ncbi:MAG: hypothetical protein NBV67_17360, partial [Tagaea sp.]|nr:hypothetical protein [Tagaea sp.]
MSIRSLFWGRRRWKAPGSESAAKFAECRASCKAGRAFAGKWAPDDARAGSQRDIVFPCDRGSRRSLRISLPGDFKIARRVVRDSLAL